MLPQRRSSHSTATSLNDRVGLAGLTTMRIPVITLRTTDEPNPGSLTTDAAAPSYPSKRLARRVNASRGPPLSDLLRPVTWAR